MLLYAFDLLELDGTDFRPQPLHVRKARLEKLLAKAPAGICAGAGITWDADNLRDRLR